MTLSLAPHRADGVYVQKKNSSPEEQVQQDAVFELIKCGGGCCIGMIMCTGVLLKSGYDDYNQGKYIKGTCKFTLSLIPISAAVAATVSVVALTAAFASQGNLETCHVRSGIQYCY